AQRDEAAARGKDMIGMLEKKLAADGSLSEQDNLTIAYAKRAVALGDNTGLVKLFGDQGGASFGKGVQGQSFDAIVASYPPDQQEAVRLNLAKQYATLPKTVSNPQGTYTMPGIDLGALSGAPQAAGGQAGGGQAIPSGFTPKPATNPEQVAKFASANMME